MHQVMISVHVPKTGGTSFHRILEYFHGEGFQLDYPWVPRPVIMDDTALRGSDEEIRQALQGIHCIHGHFDVGKYMRLMGIDGIDPVFVTWLRDPVERTISAYHYLRSLNKPPEKRGEGERQARAMGLAQFCADSGQGGNAQYAQLHRLERDQYSFFGCTERYAESMAVFAHRFFPARELPVIPHERRNEGRKGDQYDVPTSVRRVLAESNAQDLMLYQYARGWLSDALATLPRGCAARVHEPE